MSNKSSHMHPVDSVFAIGGDDDSEQEEDLLARGALRLGALAAGVSPTSESSPDTKGTPTGSVAGGDSVRYTAASPAAAVPPSRQGLHVHVSEAPLSSPSTANGRDAPSRRITGTGRGQQQAAAAGSGSKGSGSSSNRAALLRSSGAGESTPTYKPEVDGPPIIG